MVKPAAKRQLRAAAPAVNPSNAQSEHAFAEISAYVAIRDRLVAKAETSLAECDLERAADANDFVVNCLRPARSPYQAQHLSEAAAAPERKRCESVRLRLDRLRTKLANAA